MGEGRILGFGVSAAMASGGPGDQEEERVEAMLSKMNLTEKEKQSVVVEELVDEDEGLLWALVGKVIGRSSM